MTASENCQQHQWTKSTLIGPADTGDLRSYHCNACGAKAILTDEGFRLIDEFGVIQPE